jgi:hypothetical protein
VAVGPKPSRFEKEMLLFARTDWGGRAAFKVLSRDRFGLD